MAGIGRVTLLLIAQVVELFDVGGGLADDGFPGQPERPLSDEAR